jgi:hypothetical protein
MGATAGLTVGTISNSIANDMAKANQSKPAAGSGGGGSGGKSLSSQADGILLIRTPEFYEMGW